MLNIKCLSIACFGAMTLFALVPANASPLLFSFSGPSGTASFQLDSKPSPDYVNSISFLPGSDQFGFNNVAGTFNGSPGVASTINFGEGIYASFNILAPGLGFTQFSGPTLFSGPASSPAFSAGSFTLINPFFGNGKLVISPAPNAVPEPATWAMLLFGLGLTGAASRYRRRRKISPIT
jgi:hypothetical protein